jgi:hypothetical protein
MRFKPIRSYYGVKDVETAPTTASSYKPPIMPIPNTPSAKAATQTAAPEASTSTTAQEPQKPILNVNPLASKHDNRRKKRV